VLAERPYPLQLGGEPVLGGGAAASEAKPAPKKAAEEPADDPKKAADEGEDAETEPGKTASNE
jgi:hypothetical protein